MSGNNDTIDYTKRYQIRSAKTTFAHATTRRKQFEDGDIVNLNIYSPDKDASIVTIVNEGKVHTTVEEYNKYIEALAKPRVASTSLIGPPPPTDLIGVSGNGEVLLFFTPNELATNYEYSINGGSTYTTFSPAETSSPVKITGLTNNIEYPIILRSVGITGAGQGSSPVIIKPGVPNPPTNLIVTPGNGQVTVSFTILGSGGSNITNYQYSLDDGLTFRAFSPAQIAIPVTITGLQNNTSYSIQLKAMNSVGISGASTTVIGTPSITPPVESRALYLSGTYIAPGFDTITFRSFNSGGSWASQLPYTFTNTFGSRSVYIIKQDYNGVNQWAARNTRDGGTTISNLKGCVVDNAGNVFVAGRFFLTTNVYDAGPVGGAFQTLTVTPPATNGIFITKYNTGGILQWSIRVDGSNSIETPQQLSVDQAGNIYISLIINSATINIVSTNGASFTITNPGGCCILKFDKDGIYQWNILFTNCQVNSICHDLIGNMYIGGSFTSPSLSIYDTTGLATTISLSGQRMSFIGKFNSLGVLQWTTTIRCNTVCDSIALCADQSSNIYICGIFQSTLTIHNVGGGTLSYTLPYTGLSNSENSFLIKYNGDGISQWAVRFNHTSTYSMVDIITDSKGNCYITGNYSVDNGINIPIFNAGNGISALDYTFTNSGNNRTVLIKYNTNGKAQWGASLINNFTISARMLKIDEENNIYLVSILNGRAVSAVFYYPKNINTFWYTISASFTESYTTIITKYDKNGIIQWANKNTGSS